VAVVRRALELLPADGDRASLVLAAAMLDMAPAQRRVFLEHLGFSAEERDRILSAGAAQELAVALEGAASGPPSVLAAAVGAAGPEAVALAGALGPAEAARDWLQRLRHVHLEIGGRDLVSAGMPPGPAIGRGLRSALEAKLDGLTAGREDELAVALKAGRGNAETGGGTH
jgi:hypothetical protein